MSNNPWLAWLEEHTKPEPEPEPEYKYGLAWSDVTVGDYRPLLDAIRAAKVTFPVSSYDKHFYHAMLDKTDDEKLTVRQAAYLEKLFHKYRRQIPGHEKLCVICQKKGEPSNE